MLSPVYSAITPLDASQSVDTAVTEMTCTEPLLVNKSVIVSVRNVLIAAGANEFIVCNIEFMSILMNSLIIESTTILNGITEIILKKDAWAAYMLKSSPVIFNINFMIFENMSFDDSIIDEIKKEMLKNRCNIVLIGMPSAGKTTIGKMLEEKLGKEFIDLDDMIIAKAGKSIPEIFQESGEAGFRAIETEVAIEASKMNNKIIATGGGVVKHKVNMDFLRLNGITIFIDRDIDKLISSDPNRPLSSSKQALQQMYKERYPLYQKYAAYVAVNNANVEETVDDIVNAYHSILIDAVAE